ncbi:RNA polymerase sigma factor [Flavobacterium sp.]|uniref:RNA polymerase sigma factor n=1 Tax=Flavobacterium sp. TaxID=239 RepID=UPI0037BF344F
MNLDEIIQGCIKNSLAHQKALYTLYEKNLFNLSLKYCSNSQEAEDNLHDAFIEIFANIKKYKGNGSFEGWMKKIAINKAISKFKSSLLNKPLDSLIYPVFDEDIEIDTEGLSLDFLLQIIQELPSQYRLVFNLYELDDYSHKEIAESLSITVGTSKSNLHKAKIILKNKIIESQAKKYKNGI